MILVFSIKVFSLILGRFGEPSKSNFWQYVNQTLKRILIDFEIDFFEMKVLINSFNFSIKGKLRTRIKFPLILKTPPGVSY